MQNCGSPVLKQLIQDFGSPVLKQLMQDCGRTAGTLSAEREGS